MEKVVILKNGKAAKLTDAFPKKDFDVSGFLIAFEYQADGSTARYRYYKASEFRKEDERQAQGGYYREDKFLLYIQYKSEPYEDINATVPSAKTLVKFFRFDFEPFFAKKDDTVSVDICQFGSPYDFYYKQSLFEFQVEADGGSTKNYKEPWGEEILVPGNATQVPHNVDLNVTPTGFFYKKNFGDLVSSWTATTKEKKGYSRTTTLIAFRIYFIVKDIFPKLLATKDVNDQVVIDESLTKIYDAARNYLSPAQYNSLHILERTVLTLMKSWGYFYGPATQGHGGGTIITDINGNPVTEPGSTTMVNYGVLNPIFDGTASYFQYHNYLQIVANFYANMYRIQDVVANKSMDERYLYLVSLLPSSALAALPFETRIEALKLLMKGKLKEEDENLALQIIYSFYQGTNEADPFLDFLLKKEDTVTTNFDILFHKMDDERISNISSIVAFFVPQKPNRRHFCYAVYALWKVSKYNWYYTPPGVIPNADGINPQAYFLTPEGQKYYFDANGKELDGILEFSNVRSILPNGLHAVDIVDFKAMKKLSGEKVNIVKANIHEHQDDGSGYNSTGFESKYEDMYFHLFQPIVTVGYQSNLDLGVEVPQTEYPAFLFYYYEEFDRIKEMDAAISFALDVVIEVGLFFATGGLGALRHLRHLKYVTKIGRVFSGVSTATETVLVWRGLEAGLEVFTMSSSVCMSYNNYLATVANTPDERAFAEKTSRVFFYLMLVGAGASIISRTRAVRAAEEVLLDPKFNQLPLDVQDVIQSLKGSKAVTMATFRSKFANRANLLSKYDTVFTPAMRDAFFRDFGHLDGAHPIWAQLDNNAVIDNWKNLFNKNIVDRKIIDFISNQTLVNRIIFYYNELDVRNVLEALPHSVRKEFLLAFGQVDNATLQILKDHAYAIQVWAKHAPDARTLIGQHASLWIKYYKARNLLKTGNHTAVAQLFGKPLGNATLHQGVRYVTDGSFIPADLTKAIAIANRTDDVAIIAEKLGIPQNILNRAKQHYYVDEHLMLIDGELRFGRFERDAVDNAEWERMINIAGDELTPQEITAFKRLIAHEYVESQLMEKGMSYRPLFDGSGNVRPYDFGAHDLSPTIGGELRFNTADVGLEGAPSLPDLDNFSNLNNIVNWYVNLYKL